MDFNENIKRLENMAALSSNKDKPDLLFCLIDLKLTEKGYSDDIYRFSKEMIHIKIDSILETSFGYDKIPTDKYLSLFRKYPLSEQFEIISYFRKCLIQNGIDFDNNKFNKVLHMCNYRLLSYKTKPYWFLKKILLFPSLSFKHLVACLIAFFIICYLVTLPALSHEFELIIVTDYNYKGLWDHFFNTCLLIADLNENVTIKAANRLGVIILLAFKVFVYFYVTQYLIEELNKRFTKK